MTFQDETLAIDTPENVVFGYQIAGLGSRFLACAVDSLLIIVLLVFVNFALLAFLNITDLLNLGESTGAWLSALFGLLTFGIFWGYYIFFETVWNGQTPGKRRNGLRVICRDGTPVTIGETVIRNLVRIVDFLPMFYAVGIVTMFIDGQSRRLGDLAASTLVVRDREAIELGSLAGSLAPAEEFSGQPEQDLALPVERLSERDIQMVEDFFRRRSELNNRDDLARQLARSLCGRMGVPDPALPAEENERFLADLVRAFRARKTV